MVLDTARLLAERGIAALALLDAKLVVRRRFGALAQFLKDGAHVTDSVLPLVGLEAEILALREREGAMLDIPAVAIVGADEPQTRINLSVFWLPGMGRFLLLIARAQGHVDIELQMSRLMRARLMAEAEATARAKELARINRDLDEFASIVSHDLKAPMRAIGHLCDELGHALGAGDAIDPAATLERVREQARRMTQMLSELHRYARASAKSAVARVVDTRTLVEAIVRSLPRPAGMEVDIRGQWPAMETLESPLDLVIRNLIENAIKHHDGDGGLIRIEAKPGRHMLQIEVADDGPGIPAHYHETVFEPFRTLAGGEDGSGMGLALVKKTVETIGGQISLVSDPGSGRGATFIVSWPRTPAD